jgi:hypothetical protein
MPFIVYHKIKKQISLFHNIPKDSSLHYINFILFTFKIINAKIMNSESYREAA